MDAKVPERYIFFVRRPYRRPPAGKERRVRNRMAVYSRQWRIWCTLRNDMYPKQAIPYGLQALLFRHTRCACILRSDGTNNEHGHCRRVSSNSNRLKKMKALVILKLLSCAKRSTVPGAFWKSPQKSIHRKR